MNAFYEAFLERMNALHQDIHRAIAGLPQEALDWIPGAEMNSIAVLIVHTAGSERYWIGDVAVGEPSGRDREAEFRTRGLDASALQDRLDRSLTYAREALPRLTGSNLDEERGTSGQYGRVTPAWALLHALEHLGIHLGHIQMARQLWEQRLQQ